MHSARIVLCCTLPSLFPPVSVSMILARDVYRNFLDYIIQPGSFDKLNMRFGAVYQNRGRRRSN
jgi:hypothetical protein